jgi:hypothetical protein
MNKKRDLLHGRRTDRFQRGRLVQTLKTSSSSLVTGLLLACIFLLLFGLAWHLPPPAPSSPPGIFTEVSYSTLIKQVQAGQVMAVNMQGDALNALTRPRWSTTRVADAAQLSSEVVAFADCLPADVTGSFGEDEQLRFPRTRLIFTRVLEPELPSLLALLLGRQVVVTIARVYAPPPWVPLLWKGVPLWVLLLLILGTDTAKHGSGEGRHRTEPVRVCQRSTLSISGAGLIGPYTLEKRPSAETDPPW